jgi:TrmH family RNA methyltransferase
MLLKSRIKYIQSLAQKKFRDNENAFVAEGPKLIDELLASSNTRVLLLLGTAAWCRSHESKLTTDVRLLLQEISDKELNRISLLQTPNQVFGVFNKPVFPLESRHPVRLALDQIQDPGNLGTIIRVADWFALEEIYCTDDCADAFNPKVVQASMGSLCRVQVRSLDQTAMHEALEGGPVYGAVLDGPDYHKAGQVSRGIILVGNESRGIRPELLQLVNHPLSIPRRGGAESINAAVATGIVLAQLL